ncbi:ExeA family protein [Marinobacter sp.]|uniref:ExeA family protein n=1 Tax=Marinobacter sp. TaxID=50741 RepID=UPI0034A1DB1F
MYYDFFGFREPPFSIAPDPRYLYLSERHKEALAHLMYGVQGQGGFIVITGEVGTGKTTVSRCFIENVPNNVDIALILNPRLSARELLSSVCDELEIPHPVGASIKQLVDLINADLLRAHAAGRHKVLMIDEAQNLSADVLEQLRLLTNLETAEKKLLQIVLLGQPELQELLARPELRQLNQRVTARYHLDALGKDELPGYLRYRLGVAGLRADIFTGGATKKLFRASAGIPRLINLISDRALLGAYAEGEHVITAEHVRTAAKEVNGGLRGKTGVDDGAGRYRVVMVFAFVVLAATATLWLFDRWHTDFRADAPQASERESNLSASEDADTDLRTGTIERLDTEPDATVVTVIPDSPQSFDFGQHSSSLANAYRSLLSVWDLEYSPTADLEGCEFASANGLRCLDRQGTRRSLELLDRPAMLELRDGEGRQRYVVLRSIRDEQAVLVVSGMLRSVAFSSLEPHWLGDYTVLWQMPPYMSKDGDADAGDNEQLWMGARMMELAELHAEDREESDRVKRLDTGEQVRWYQRQKGLTIDGIAGAMTLIQINNDLDEAGPRLSDQVQSDQVSGGVN